MSRPDTHPSVAATTYGLSSVDAAALLPAADYTPAAATSLVAGLDHPEDVAWDPTRNRVIAGGEAGQIYGVDLATGTANEIARATGQVLGVALDSLGRIVACVAGSGQVQAFDGDTWTRVLDTVDGEPLALPNYAAFAPDGTLFVSDSGAWRADTGRIVMLRTDGTSTTVSRKLPYFTNGLAVSADGTQLYVAESESARFSSLDLVALAAGDDPDPQIVAEIPGTIPDGIAVVSDGSLVLTCYRPDIVFHLRRDGTLAVIGHDWQGTAMAGPTNACFAGPDLDILVTANLNRWHLTVLAAGLRGTPPHRPARWGIDA